MSNKFLAESIHPFSYFTYIEIIIETNTIKKERVFRLILVANNAVTDEKIEGFWKEVH